MQKFQPSAGEVLLSRFSDSQGVTLTDFVKQRATNTCVPYFISKLHEAIFIVFITSALKISCKRHVKVVLMSYH